MDEKCVHCKVFKWEEETAGMCCSGGKVSLPLLDETEEPLKSLLLHDSEESRRYLNRIRKYNSCFEMTSYSVDRKVIMPGFFPTFNIQGQQVYHKIGSLLLVANQ
ncbi:hypothetical protein AVEN_130313-1 [Araneus ventricosus]|uniref:Helitron helicase-like domain-containing protein n=1 Tax=Araneus ventricosus TaxID=182803 RepID=A0A4Y2BF75_ARAVE|nr:hypothetical protein AVEN_130313-1 [Araneus ventricosus]